MLRLLSWRKLLGGTRKLRAGKKTVVIISTGRTGTKFLESFFSGHPEVLAVHEPKPSRILKLWSNAKLEGKTPDSFLAKVLYGYRKKALKKNYPAIYVESNPFIVGFSGVLDDVFDKPIIIHIVRDPRSYIKSALNHGNTRGIKKIFNKYVPFWYPDIKKIHGLSREPNLMIRTAYYWHDINKHLRESCSKSPGYHLFRFEDLFSSDHDQLKKLLKAAGLGDVKIDIPAAKNQSKDKAIKGWQDWSREDCRQIDNICRAQMKAYGYGNEPEWLKKLEG